MATTVNTRRHWVQKDAGDFFRRADAVRDFASRVVQTSMVRKARAYSPLLSAKKLSVAKHTGGELGGVGVMILAMARLGDRHGVEQIRAYINAVCDAATIEPGCPKELTIREQRLNAAEDEASLSFLNGGDPVALMDRIREEIAVEQERLAALMQYAADQR